MKLKTLEFKNDFHNSYATIRAKVMPNGRLFVTARQMADANRKMCGMADCECPGGNIINEPMRYAWEQAGDGYIIEPCLR